MEPFRLKLKVGPHEFEAEGNQETVEKQLAVWRELIASPSSLPIPALVSPPPPTPASAAPTPVIPVTASVTNGEITRDEYDKIFEHDGRVVSLTVHPTGDQKEADTALLLLHGQKIYNGLDQVTGQQLLDGMKRSGMTQVERADRVLGNHIGPNVLRTGSHRGVKYRLTHPGVAKAREIERDLLSMVP